MDVTRLKRPLVTAENLLRSLTYDRLGRPPRSPLMIYVELTRRCNMRCRHCDIWQTSREGKDLESLEVPGG